MSRRALSTCTHAPPPPPAQTASMKRQRPSRQNPFIGRTAFAALCALVLAGCGTERADGDRSAAALAQSTRPATEETRSEKTGPEGTQPEDTEGPDFLPFMQLLVDLGEPCLPSDLRTALPPDELEELEDLEELEELASAAPTVVPSTFPSEDPARVPVPVPLPDDAPPPTSEPRDPADALKEVELSSIEECDARIHERRIAKALQGADNPAPTPAQVGTVLRGLGYIDERVNGPQQDGESAEFTLDLRLLGGGPCLTGRVQGTEVAFESYGGHPEVDCQDVRLDER